MFGGEKDISNNQKQNKSEAAENNIPTTEEQKDFKVPKSEYAQYLKKIGVFEKTKKPQMDGWIVQVKGSLRAQMKNRKGQQPTFNFFHTIGTDYVELDHQEYAKVEKAFKENKTEADD